MSRTVREVTLKPFVKEIQREKPRIRHDLRRNIAAQQTQVGIRNAQIKATTAEDRFNYRQAS